MKTICKFSILTVAFSLIFNIASSQNKKLTSFSDKKHQISFGIDNLFAKNKTVYYQTWFGSNRRIVPNFEEYRNNFAEIPQFWLGYKLNFRTGAVRLKVLAKYLKEEETREDNYNIKYEGYIFGVYLGYEFHKDYNKVQFFYGFDFFANQIEEINESTNNTIYPTYTYKTENHKIGIGVCPLIGVKYYITPFLSLSTEYRLQVESYSGYEKSTYNGTLNKNNFNGFSTHLGSLGQLSINIHL